MTHQKRKHKKYNKNIIKIYLRCLSKVANTGEKNLKDRNYINTIVQSVLFMHFYV